MRHKVRPLSTKELGNEEMPCVAINDAGDMITLKDEEGKDYQSSPSCFLSVIHFVRVCVLHRFIKFTPKAYSVFHPSEVLSIDY